MPSAVPLVLSVTRAVAETASALRPPKPHAASSSSSPGVLFASGGAKSPSSSAMLAARRLLALRLVFDLRGALRAWEAWYRARVARLSGSLRRRGYPRLHALVEDPPMRAAACALALGALALAYRAGTAGSRERRRAREARRDEIRRRLDAATRYEEYRAAAHEMERLEEDIEREEEEASERRDTLKSSDETKKSSGKTPAAGKKTRRGGRRSTRSGGASAAYDRELIEEQLRVLRAKRASGDVGEMMFGLRADILRNLGNMSDIGRKLHEPLWGVPRVVREYIDETKAQLRDIARGDNEVPIQEKLAFLQETRHCFGRTALLLSGGGTLGTFHVGVARALQARGCLPRVLVGSSVGSIVAAIVASRTPSELDEFFSEEHFWDLLPDMTFFSGRDFFSSVQHLVRTGALHDIDFFQRCLRALLGDLTFQEAYDRSGGRILCVCVCATRAGEKPRLLNYLTSPHLVVWSAVAASCAFPSLFPPQPLLAKSRNGAFVPWQPEGKLGARLWRDGSLENDLPMRGLSELFNVNYFIVSQTNPHIVPILRVKRWFASMGPACAVVANFLESEWRHRCTQILDLAPSLDAFDFAKLFGQEWEGNVTVVMAYSWKQFKQIATNPTREFLYETATMGEREMWPKLATIESNCGIEMQLDECVRTLREKLAESVGTRGGTPRRGGGAGGGVIGLKHRGRVPSWNTINYCGRDSYLHMREQVFGSVASGGAAAYSANESTPEASWGAMSVSANAGSPTPSSPASARAHRPSGGGGGGHSRGGSRGEKGSFWDASSAGRAESSRESAVSRTSSAGSLSEFVAVVQAEEAKWNQKQQQQQQQQQQRGGKSPAESPDAGGAFDGGLEASEKEEKKSAAALDRRPDSSWPVGQKMPTALMKIGSVKLGASAALLPETFGAAARGAAEEARREARDAREARGGDAEESAAAAASASGSSGSSPARRGERGGSGSGSPASGSPRPNRASPLGAGGRVWTPRGE